jgi:DnaD/phage-associated family protein
MKKTDEEQGKYATEKEDSLNNAHAMMGWDDAPSIVVEPPRKITVRRGRKMVEQDEPAWVKFSTDFKDELADLSEYSLKVFIYIGLAVGFETGTAYPGIRKIAEDTKMNKSTVQKCIAELEEKGFMDVYRRDGNSNIYKPTRYFSIGTVRPDRTVETELSGENAELSGGQEGNLHNKNNKTFNQEEEEGAPSVFQVYSNEIGLLTPFIADAIESWEKDVPPTWIVDAIHEAVSNNARNWKYIEAILKRWKAQGHQGKTKKAATSSTSTPKPKIFDAIADFLGSEYVEQN